MKKEVGTPTEKGGWGTRLSERDKQTYPTQSQSDGLFLAEKQRMKNARGEERKKKEGEKEGLRKGNV